MIKLFKVSHSHYLTASLVGNKAKGRISKQVFQENKARQIFRKTNISYLLIRTRTCAYQGVRNVRFSENLACFVFLKHPFWDSPFCLITDELNIFTKYSEISFNHQIDFPEVVKVIRLMENNSWTYLNLTITSLSFPSLYLNWEKAPSKIWQGYGHDISSILQSS